MAPPLRILHVTTSWPRTPADPDGSFVAALVAAQRAAGRDVHVAMPPANGILGDLRSPLRWPRLARSLYTLWRRARPVQHAWPAQIVHASWWPCAAIARLHRRPSGAPAPRLIVTLHGSDVELLTLAPLRWLARWALRDAASIHAVSQSLADRATKLLGPGMPSVVVTRNGDDDVVVPTGDPLTRTRVLFAGHLERHKGARDLPVLAAALRARGIDAAIDIYGSGSLRELLAHRLRDQRGVGVHLHGAVPRAQLLTAIGNAAVVVCPSYIEGFGLVCREAIDRGTPVAAYATGGLIEQLASVDGDVAPGQTVAPGDINALADAVAALLGDATLRRAVHDRAIANAGSVRSWNDVAADYDRAYDFA